MNINEVPQDERNFKGGEKLRKLVYAVDKDGKYTSTNSAGWEAENFAMKQAWDAVEDKLAETEAQVKAGQLSPIAYYMEKSLMDVALLAKYVGKWQWQVKRHMKPEVFAKLSPALLQRYAGIFNVTAEELKNYGKA